MIFLFVAGLALLALILVARLFGQLRHVNQRFDNVQARLRRLEEGLPRPAPPTSAGPSVFASPAPPPRVTPSPVLPSSAHTSPPPLPAAAPAAAARPAVVTAAARTRADLETEIGSRWALVIGVLVLALGLLGLTVAKLFTIDLVALDGIYRIVGFIVMGLVLLAASFLYHRSLRRSSSVAA